MIIISKAAIELWRRLHLSWEAIALSPSATYAATVARTPSSAITCSALAATRLSPYCLGR
ncbi:hypothetical protein [Nostoc sp. 'Peltigera membranacea cyanobiont' N6]|uniref:hypothetical protein n=1 Tax=Nostoc sp. 'Peltigera membranacea cyanobiont' N6 TaxID=1261031 RepID=UPI000CF3109F|nr:hypothetical protein [Nostoc sp. 'Peltigera membranacea cyanobiont' N6]